MWRVAGNRLFVRRSPALPIWVSLSQEMTRTHPIATTPFNGLRLSTKSSAPKFSSRRSPSRKLESYCREERDINQNLVNSINKRAKDLVRKLNSRATAIHRTELHESLEVINTWSGLKLPTESQQKIIPLIDKLLTKILEQQPNSETALTTILPTSESLCSMVIAWSKSDLPNAAERSEYWLRLMMQLAEKYPDQGMAPRPSLFSPVISAWERRALTDPEVATRRGQSVWQQLQELIRETKNENDTISISSSDFYMYLSLWSKSGLPEAPMQAESVLREMIQAGEKNPKVIPSCRAFVNVITAWRKNNSLEAPLRAQRVLDIMVEEHWRRREMPQERMGMDINDAPFNAAIQAWVASVENGESSVSSTMAEKRINEILKTMANCDVRPTPVTVWNILPLFSDESVRDTPKKILQLMDHVGGIKESRNNITQNKAFLRAIEICCMASSKSTDHSRPAEIAEEILFQRYLKLPRKHRRLELNMQAYVAVVQAWNHQLGNPNLPPGFVQSRIQGVLDRMEKESNRILEHKGNPSVHAFLAQAWANNSALPGSLKKVESHVGRLLEFCGKSTEFQPRPTWFHDIVAAVEKTFPGQQSSHFSEKLYRRLTEDSQQFFRMIISDGSRGGNSFDHRDQDFLDQILYFLASKPNATSGKRAEMVLLKMQEMQEKHRLPLLTFDSFKRVLFCWSKSSEEGAAKRAEEILSLAEELYASGDAAMKPDMDAYSSVIDAWSRSYSPDAPEKIKRLLFEIQRRRADGDETFGTNDGLYASLIRAYGYSGQANAARMAQAVFDTTPDHMRTTAVYNSLIEAQGGDPSRAEEILQDMHHSFAYEGNEWAMPETETFNAVILAWLRSGSPMTAWRADGIFKRMQDLTSNGHLNVQPNSRTFDLVISALAQGDGVELKIDNYLSLLRQCYLSGKLECSPTITSYSEALKAWCSKEDDPHAFLRAKALLDEMHELARDGLDGVRPNRKTYEIFLEALSRSFPEARADLAKDVIEKMKEDSVEIDGDMRWFLQRCFLPPDRPMSSFVVQIDENP